MICIKNGTLHTAVSKETFIADILIDGGKIVKIGKGLSADGAEVIDATGLQVYPGFVEAHCHIGLDGYGIGYEGHDYNELNDPVTPQVQAIDGMTADWFKIPWEVLGVISNRIINEVKGINRVVYDISSKPPSTIEWE